MEPAAPIPPMLRRGLSTRTKIFLYVKILSSFIDSPPTLFPTLINKKDMLTEAIYSQCKPRNLPLAPENLSRESASSCSATCPWSFAAFPKHKYYRMDGDLLRGSYPYLPWVGCLGITSFGGTL